MHIEITRTRLIIAAAVVLAVGGYFVADWLIVTDKERVQARIDALGSAVEANDVEALMGFFDTDFRIAGMDAQEFRAWYADILQLLRVKKASQYETTVEMDKADRTLATAEVQAYILLERPKSEARVDWRLVFRRRGENDWKLVSARAYSPRDHSEIPLSAIRGLLGM